MSNENDIGVVGSPSTSTELTVDLLLEATEERLVGALVGFHAQQDGRQISSIGQIVGLELRNKWHEDSVFRNLIKRTGEIPPITYRQDTRIADLVIGATFKKTMQGYDPEVLGMVPSTGTRIFRMSQELLDSMLELYQEELFYLGRAYANDILYPMWLKHFGSGTGGAGEAHHIGVFGKTGSGKSGLAKMMLCGYGKHKQMGILVIDPQGEFSSELSGHREGQQGLPLDSILKNQGRDVCVYKIDQLQLSEWDMFQELLVSLGFLETLNIPKGSKANAGNAAEIIRIALEGRSKLGELSNENVLNAALNAVKDPEGVKHIYTTRARAEVLVARINKIQTDSTQRATVLKKWRSVCDLFAEGKDRKKLWSHGEDGIVNELLREVQNGEVRPVVAIDISQKGNKQEFWSESLQKKIITQLLRALIYKASSDSANVLVVLDEAHRHVPSGNLESGSEADQLRSLLRRGVRETRKYGLGWMFISQTLGGLDREILQQLRILTFGFGLALGTELDRLKEFAGGDKRAIELYQSFRDPQSFPRRDLQDFPFMAVGPITPLAFSGKPIFFSMFTNMDEFQKKNKLGKS